MSAPTKAQRPDDSTHELWQIVEAGDVGTRSRRFIPDGMFHDFSDSDVVPRGGNQEVRTLHDPPDIWNLVPETRVEFNPRSAFFGHITSLRNLVLFVIMLPVGGVAAFGFMKLWDLALNDHAVSIAPSPTSVSVASTTAASSPPVAAIASAEAPLRTDDGNTTIASSSLVTEAKTTALSSNVQATTTSEIARSKVDAKITVPARVPAKQVLAKRRRGTRLSSTVIGHAVVGRTDDEDKNQTSATPGPKSDNEKADRPTAAQKEENKADKIAPTNGSAAPKPKVIQWP